MNGFAFGSWPTKNTIPIKFIYLFFFFFHFITVKCWMFIKLRIITNDFCPHYVLKQNLTQPFIIRYMVTWAVQCVLICSYSPGKINSVTLRRRRDIPLRVWTQLCQWGPNRARLQGCSFGALTKLNRRPSNWAAQQLSSNQWVLEAHRRSVKTQPLTANNSQFAAFAGDHLS